jgi:hypothetical protein
MAIKPLSERKSNNDPNQPPNSESEATYPSVEGEQSPHQQQQELKRKNMKGQGEVTQQAMDYFNTFTSVQAGFIKGSASVTEKSGQIFQGAMAVRDSNAQVIGKMAQNNKGPGG